MVSIFTWASLFLSSADTNLFLHRQNHFQLWKALVCIMVSTGRSSPSSTVSSNLLQKLAPRIHLCLCISPQSFDVCYIYLLLQFLITLYYLICSFLTGHSLGGALANLCLAYFTFPSDRIERTQAQKSLRARLLRRTNKPAAESEDQPSVDLSSDGRKYIPFLLHVHIFQFLNCEPYCDCHTENSEIDESNFRLSHLSDAAKAAFKPIQVTGTENLFPFNVDK